MTRRGLFGLLLAPLLARFRVPRRELTEADLRQAADAIWARQASLEAVSLPVSNGVIENLTDDMCRD